MSPAGIDVIIPCYNYGRYLRQCTASVLQETRLPVRVLIIDDGSTDNSTAVALELAAQDPRVQVISHSANQGHIATYNQGIEWVQATYMLLLSADDMVAPGALGRAVALMEANPEIAFVYGRAIRFADDADLACDNASSEKAEGAPIVKPGIEFIREICADPRNPVETATVVVRSAVQKRVGGYSPEFPHAGDLEMWLRFARQGDVGVLRSVQALVRMHQANMRRAYVGTGDYQQRSDIFHQFFDAHRSALPDAAGLKRQALRSLAREVLQQGSNALDTGRSHTELIRLARQIRPGVVATWPYWKVAAKRMITAARATGERSAVAGGICPRHEPKLTADRKISVLFCCDPGYYQHLAVALVSMLRSNTLNSFDIHLVSSGSDKAAESLLSASISNFDNFKLTTYHWKSSAKLHESYHVTRDTYTRLFADSILDPSIEKILYLDSDLIVVDDLYDLWTTDVEDYVLAAAPDPYGDWRREALGMPDEGVYVNAGVLMMNLRKWRADDVTPRLTEYIERQGENLLFHDQDAINAVLHGATRVLDYRWNFQARMLRPSGIAALPDRAAIRDAARAPAIIHYTSERKPWKFAIATPAKRLYRNYAKLTEWRATPAIGRTWANLPAYVVNHVLYLAGSEYTWERLLRSTTIGRALDRLLRPLRRAPT